MEDVTLEGSKILFFVGRAKPKTLVPPIVVRDFFNFSCSISIAELSSDAMVDSFATCRLGDEVDSYPYGLLNAVDPMYDTTRLW